MIAIAKLVLAGSNGWFKSFGTFPWARAKQQQKNRSSNPIKPKRRAVQNKESKIRVVKTTYQIRPDPIHDPRIARFRGLPPRPAPNRVQNLRSQTSIWGSIARAPSKARTSVKSILRGHAGVLLERRQRPDINRPFTELHRLALEEKPIRYVPITAPRSRTHIPRPYTS